MHVQTLVELRLRNLAAEMRKSGHYYAEGWAKALDGFADELASDRHTSEAYLRAGRDGDDGSGALN